MSAHTAICGRWVTQSTCARLPTVHSFFPTTSPARLPMPASISSNTSDGAPDAVCSALLSASIIRDVSPPDATFASGRDSSPGFVRAVNVTRSIPFGEKA